MEFGFNLIPCFTNFVNYWFLIHLAFSFYPHKSAQPASHSYFAFFREFSSIFVGNRFCFYFIILYSVFCCSIFVFVFAFLSVFEPLWRYRFLLLIRANPRSMPFAFFREFSSIFVGNRFLLFAFNFRIRNSVFCCSIFAFAFAFAFAFLSVFEPLWRLQLFYSFFIYLCSASWVMANSSTLRTF